MADELKWEAAKVGCYWYSGPYTIGTFRQANLPEGVQSGYRLTYKFGIIAQGDTLEQVKAAAESHRQSLAKEIPNV
jgi:hypothetical protein